MSANESAWPFGYPRSPRRIIMVFELYLDDSSTNPGDRIISMSGLVARADAWAAIEPALDETMNRYGVPIFQAKQFNATRAPFKGWPIIKKVSFTEEMFAPTKGLVLQGITFSARNSSFRRRKAETGLIKNMSAFAVCFSALLVRLLHGFSFSDEIATEGMSIFLELGNKNNGGIEDFVRRQGQNSIFRGAIKELRLIPKNACRAIQLADFLAFYSRKHADNVDRFDGELAMPIGRYLEVMEKYVPILSHTITDPFAGDQDHHPTSEYGYVKG